MHAGDRRVPGEQVTELGVVAAGDRHRLADREVDVLAVTGVPGAPRRGRHSYRRERARDPLARAAARLDGYVVGRATTHETARLCLHDELGGRSAGVRPRATVRRDGQDHEARMSVEEVEAVEHLGREALDDHVPARDELQRGLVTGRADHGAHAVVQEPEQRPALHRVHARGTGRPGAPRVTAGRLHLHDVGAGVGEQPAAVSARDAEGEVDDPQIGKAAFHRWGYFASIGRKYGSVMPPVIGWNSTCTRIPTSGSSGSHPTRFDSIFHPSSSSTITAVYGTVKAGVCGRHTVVQL